MSHDASIDMFVPAGYGVHRVLTALLHAGWSYDDHGFIRTLPLHDGDQFNWRARPLTEWPAAVAEMIEKEQGGEIVGVALMWQETMRGGEVLFFKDSISVSASSNRVELISSEFTDFGWYMERLVPPIEGIGVRVSRVACSDHR